MIDVFTDGSSLGNPGPGGYGVLMKMRGTDYVKAFSQGYQLTTNNRMELLAVIIALESITKPKQEVTVYSDSKYVVEAITQGWIHGWVKKSFKGVKNPDLWTRFLKAYKDHKVNFEWIKGHAGHAENEECDKLAVAAAKGEHLLVDIGYENAQKGDIGLF